MTIRQAGAELFHADRRTDMAKLIIAIRSFANVPNKYWISNTKFIKLLKPTGHVMHQQFNIQQLYAMPTLYVCVLYLSENKQRLVPLTA